MEGYGMTETTGVGTANTRAAHRFGTVGRPMPGVEVRIAEEDGEILLRGPNIFRGYWRNEEATREVLDDDGWLHTGDLGSVDEDGYLSITGRKKDIIITAGGKNLTPANIENDLKQSPFISQAVMYGDRRPYPVALVTLDPEEIGPWARERGLSEDPAALARDPQVIEHVQGVLDHANRKYAQVEQVKRFFILDHDLSQETGELTPTLKVKRNVVNEKYADAFAALYDDAG
jgi:long-chain acyl-CoA synthetase